MLVPLIIIFFTTTHGSLIRHVGDPEKPPNVRIIGGDIAPDGLAPYQVSFQRQYNSSYPPKHICGGSILNEQWVLTAAHCLMFIDMDFFVLAGTHKLNVGGVMYAVEKKIPHDKDVTGKFINDIALVKLAKKIEFTDKIQPIALPTKDTEAGANLMVTWWGLTSWHGRTSPQPSNDLRVLNQTALSNAECKKRMSEANNPFIPQILPIHLCAYNDVGHGACQGDSGGPLVEGNALVGVVSFAEPCAKGFPDGYCRVYSYLDWISETMKAN